MHEDMQVIRHSAISVQKKCAFSSALAKDRKYTFRDGWVRKMWSALVTADGYKVRLLTEVGDRIQASGFAVDGHATVMLPISSINDYVNRGQ